MEEKKIRELANRLYDLLDPYEVADTDTTSTTVYTDLINNPLDVVEYLTSVLEDLNARGQI